jgi:hypothetical protein
MEIPPPPGGFISKGLVSNPKLIALYRDMNFGSSLLNEFMRTGGTINGRPIPGRETNTIIQPTLPTSVAPTPSTTAKKISRKRKEVREVKRAPSDDIKKLLESDPLDKKAVELFFLNKLLRLITEEEEG